VRVLLPVIAAIPVVLIVIRTARVRIEPLSALPSLASDRRAVLVAGVISWTAVTAAIPSVVAAPIAVITVAIAVTTTPVHALVAAFEPAAIPFLISLPEPVSRSHP